MYRFLSTITALVIFVGAINADEKKIDGAKLIGKWEITKTSGGAPKGSIIEFQKDGKLLAKLDIEGMKIELTGTHSLKDNKLVVKIKGPDGGEMEETLTIKTLTDDKLVLIDKDNKEDELERKKDKK